MSIAACTLSGILARMGLLDIWCCIHVSLPSTRPMHDGLVGFRPRCLNSSALSNG